MVRPTRHSRKASRRHDIPGHVHRPTFPRYRRQPFRQEAFTLEALGNWSAWDVRYIDAPVCRDEDQSDGEGGAPDGDCEDPATGIQGTGQGSNEGDEHLYYCEDANFNVTALVDGYDGAVVERYVYSPYGAPTVLHGTRDAAGNTDAGSEWDEWEVRTSDTFGNEILYCGYRYDPETGLYHVRFRPYHAPLGRWVVPEPGGVYRDGMSLYEYATGDPLGVADPSGLWAKLDGSDYVYCAEAFDTLQELAREVSGSAEDWACIWPTRDNWCPEYPNVKVGEKYDVSNLVRETARNLYVLMLWSDRAVNFLKKDRPGAIVALTGNEVYNIIKEKSEEGRRPITNYEFVGHGWHSWGGMGAFGNTESEIEKKKVKRGIDVDGFFPKNYKPDEPRPSWARVRNWKGPHRCWFSHRSVGRLVTCSGIAYGRAFARTFLRKGSKVWATKHGFSAFITEYGFEDSYGKRTSYRNWWEWSNAPEWEVHWGRN